MRLALIADIHGNLAALEAVLAEIGQAGVDQTICLGDVAATGPQPRQILDRLRQLACPVVMGNADAELFEPGPPPEPGSDMARFAEISAWAAAQLSADDLAYLRSFQPTIAVPLEGGGTLLCVHGSPRGFNDVILATTPEADLVPMLAGTSAGIIAGGHTHFPLLRRYRQQAIINPGSAGLAYSVGADGNVVVPAYAEYAILTVTPGHRRISFECTGYDQTATVRAMFAAGMPHAAWWAAGWQQAPA